jgi:hypothetical protein
MYLYMLCYVILGVKDIPSVTFSSYRFPFQSWKPAPCIHKRFWYSNWPYSLARFKALKRFNDLHGKLSLQLSNISQNRGKEANDPFYEA